MSAPRMTPLFAAVVLLAAWLGAVLLVAAVVAPAAFAVLPTRALAGELVGRVLPVIFWAGVAVGVAAALLGAAAPLRWRAVAALVLVASSLAAQLVVSPRIAGLRAAAGGPIDSLDPSSPLRQAFGRLHGLSVACLGIGALAAAGLLVLLLRAAHQVERVG